MRACHNHQEQKAPTMAMEGFDKQFCVYTGMYFNVKYLYGMKSSYITMVSFG